MFESRVEERYGGSKRRSDARKAVAVFGLSFLTLAGVLLTVVGLDSLGDWTEWQFVGLFGLLEAGAGLGSVYAPNFWLIPVRHGWPGGEGRHLGLRELKVPHFSAAGRIAAGATMLAGATVHEGSGPATLSVALPLAAVAGVLLAASALVARWGLANAGVEIFQVVIRRAAGDVALPHLAIGASLVQFAFTVLAIPLVRIVPTGALYGPEVRASAGFVAVSLAIVGAFGIAAVAAWRGRLEQ
jgi:hypothetical protein